MARINVLELEPTVKSLLESVHLVMLVWRMSLTMESLSLTLVAVAMAVIMSASSSQVSGIALTLPVSINCVK